MNLIQLAAPIGKKSGRQLSSSRKLKKDLGRNSPATPKLSFQQILKDDLLAKKTLKKRNYRFEDSPFLLNRAIFKGSKKLIIAIIHGSNWTQAFEGVQFLEQIKASKPT